MADRSDQQSLVADRWLSETVGFDCFNISIGDVAKAENCFPDGLITTKLDLSSGETPERLTTAIGLGFRVVTVQVLLSGFVERGEALSRARSDREHIEVRAAQASDEAEVVRLGQTSFSFDRFHSDPLIPREIGDKIKRAWVESFFHGARGTSMTVAKVSGAIRGFLLADESNDRILIDLIAVDSAFQGQGIASKLLSHKVRLIGGHQVGISVGTQLTNRQSLTFYKAWKLEPVKHEIVLHRIKGL